MIHSGPDSRFNIQKGDLRDITFIGTEESLQCLAHHHMTLCSEYLFKQNNTLTFKHNEMGIINSFCNGIVIILLATVFNSPSVKI